MSPAWAARNTAIDLFLALVLATAVAVSIWYFVGDGDKREPGPWGSNPGKLKGEYAVRLAVNLSMYVLCSNYKDDQVHAQALMRRRGRSVP